jgi:sec-independent protein translocase protein TatC
MKKSITIYLQLHFLELKYNFFISLITFIYLFTICYYFSDQLIYLIIKTLLDLKILKYFIFNNIIDFFLTNFLISLFSAILIFLPFLFFQLWFFFSSGLFKYENIKILKIFLIYFFFSLIIIYFIFIKIIPNIWFFFFNETFTNKYLFYIHFEPKLNNFFYFFYYSFIYIYLLLLYPILLFLLIFCKILKIKNLIFYRKFFILKIFIFSAFIAPPDIINQLIIAIPFIIIFEIFIYLSIFFNKYFKN